MNVNFPTNRVRYLGRFIRITSLSVERQDQARNGFHRLQLGRESKSLTDDLNLNSLRVHWQKLEATRILV